MTSGLSIAAAGLQFIGMGALALTQTAHRQAVGAAILKGASLAVQRRLGLTVLALALPLLMAAHGPAAGFLIWVGLGAAMAALITALLSARPSWLAPFARLTPGGR